MPNNRKSSKYMSSRVNHSSQPNETKSSTEDSHLSNSLGGVNRLTMPRHISLPPLPTDSELAFETIAFIFGSMALFLQLLNLYRTVWWLPHSYNTYAVNFYLIDFHVVAYVIIILGRRLIWHLLKLIFTVTLSPTLNKHILPYYQKFTYFTIFSVMIWLIWCIAWKHPVVRMLYLSFPIVMYSMLFNTNITAFFELLPSSKPNLDSKNCKGNSTVFGNREVRHICHHEADAVRKEVGFLKLDFNYRLKQVLFNALLSTYYAGFIPYSFAQNVLYYDTHWMTQQLICLLISSFTMYVVYIFSPNYCNTLHCSALHLGRWIKIEGPASHMPHASYESQKKCEIVQKFDSPDNKPMRYVICFIILSGTVIFSRWSDSVLWHHGALVKHRKELYRGDGISNAAEPGNTVHCRFYIVFKDPSSILCGVVGLQVTLLVSQLALLALCKEWNYIITHSLLIISNYYTLFKLIRDYLVLGKFYRTEEILQRKTVS